MPLLLDLQAFDPKFVFEPRTVQRMELWVMSILDWRLRSVTPFDFLPSFVPKLPSLSSPSSPCRVLSTSSDLIVSTARGNVLDPIRTPFHSTKLNSPMINADSSLVFGSPALHRPRHCSDRLPGFHAVDDSGGRRAVRRRRGGRRRAPGLARRLGQGTCLLS